jgi:hypothetical protein
MAAAIYTTLNQEGVDINQVFLLDPKTPEYPNPPFGVGTQAFGTDGSAWVYATASITIAAGSAVLLSSTPGNWSVALVGGATVATSPIGQLVGIVGGSQGSMVVPAPSGTQTGSFFWVQRDGNAPNVRTLASTTKNVQLYGTATAGGVLSSSGGGAATTYQVNGIVISVATGSAAGPNSAVLNWPTVSTSA